MRILAGMLTLIVFGSGSFAQPTGFTFIPEHPRHLFAFHSEEKENEGDPGYALYKTGYNQILEEKWGEALKTFARLQDRFPKSDYRDDAAYWSAYAMKYSDIKKAAKEYQKFIEAYPKSSYYDDAIADLSELEARMELDGVAPTGISIPPHPGRHLDGVPPQPQTFAFESMQRDLDRQMQHMNRRLRTLPRAMRGFRYHFGTLSNESTLDQDTKIKLEALYALGESHDDKDAFAALKSVALDRGKNVALRAAALDALCDFTTFDVLPIVLDVARNDTSARLQDDAIAFIDRVSKDKDRSVSTLIDLYHSLPPERKDQRESIFYAIADIGQDKSVDFLTNVAKTSKDYDLRRAAIYYLGNIGSDRSRKALLEILQEK